MKEITAETMKTDAAAYIAEQLNRMRGEPDRKTAKIIAPFVTDGPTRELIILFMCGFATRVVEDALKAQD